MAKVSAGGFGDSGKRGKDLQAKAVPLRFETDGGNMSDLFEQAKTRILDRIESPRDLLEFKLGAALKMERTVLGMLDTLHDEARRDELKQQFHHHSDETRMQIQNIERSFSLLGRDADEKPCP